MRLVRKFSLSGYILTFCSLLPHIAFAADEIAPVLDKAAVVKLVRAAHIFEPTAKINAAVDGKEIIVQSYLNPKANDNDCKIDSVLLAKAIYDVFPPPAFSSIRVNLYDSQDPARAAYRSVIVRAGDIEVFAHGSISKEALLASLTVAHENRVDTVKRSSPRAVLGLTIKSGFKTSERQDLLNNIRGLQAKNQELGQNIANIDRCCELFSLSEAALERSDVEGFKRSYNDAAIAFNEEQAKVNRAITQLYSKLPMSGPQYDRRLAIYKRLDYLEQRGIDVSQLRRIFELDIEPLARSGQDNLELDVSLNTVERALSKY